MGITLPRPWAAHAQIEWDRRVADHTLPTWLRVVCLAYGRHEANGHATFGRGQLSWILGRPPNASHQFQRADRWTVRDAISAGAGRG